MDTRGSKPEEPYFGFDLFLFRRRRKAGRLTVGGQRGRHSKAVGSTDGQMINCNNVCWAVVETVTTLEIQFHGGKAVVAIEPDLSRTAVLETRLSPRGKDVTGSKNRPRRNYGLYRILSREAQLPMGRAIRECQWKVSLMGARIVQCGNVPVNGHRNW